MAVYAANNNVLSRYLSWAYSKLESDVLIMEPAEDRNQCDAANLLDPAKIRSILCGEVCLTTHSVP